MRILQKILRKYRKDELKMQPWTRKIKHPEELKDALANPESKTKSGWSAFWTLDHGQRFVQNRSILNGSKCNITQEEIK